MGATLTDHAMLHVRFRKPGMAVFRPWERSENAESISDYFRRRVGPYAQYGPTSFAYLQSPSAVAAGHDHDRAHATAPHNAPYLVVPLPVTVESTSGARTAAPHAHGAL